MKILSTHYMERLPIIIVSVVALLLLGTLVRSQNRNAKSTPIIVTARIENGRIVYTLNGRRVEDRRDNSLLKNLTEIVTQRGKQIPVFIIIDVRAPFTEAGKLETALDKADLTFDRRLFVTDFRDGTMNEIHWDQKPIPVPQD